MHVRFGDNPKPNYFKREKLQDKAIHIISFLPKDASVKEAYSTRKILKKGDFISLQNALLPW